MLKRIKAQNFLSLRNVDLELGARNVFVGPNMSGKSNLIESLKFLQESVSRPEPQTPALQKAFAKRGGFSEVVWKGAAQGPISLEVIAELSDPKSRESRSYDYKVSFRPGEYHAQEVQAEKLTLGVAGTSNPILESAEGKSKIAVAGESTVGAQNRAALELETQARFAGFEGTMFWNFVANWRFYHLVPELMRQSNPPAWENYLLEHGENLSTWLLTLQNRPQEFQRIKQACRDVLSGLAEILFQPVEPPTRAVIDSSTGGISVPFGISKDFNSGE
jgi:predicted ATPase